VADAPWRCSECGTVNEPVANACRTCGRWPSLFDLQQSMVDEVEEELPLEEDPSFEPQQAFEPDVVREDVDPEPEQLPRGEQDEAQSPASRGRRRWTRLIIPIGVMIYLVVTNIVNR